MEQSEAISIHALRKESDFGFRGSVAGKHISIHALRKESDRVQLRLGQVGAISIHALRKESDPRLGEVDSQVCEFQSTISVRRATRIAGESCRHARHFNPRSP